ncbi:hypothetical protein [Desulfovibrio sp. JC010]|uniref:hypothetical protein n=1 Tax=Desulfovibrio sp. JC010 TaxID=2593641 RepID=UPI0013D468B6|nr:hypothetical protein [Desulfovibrio sp. JC010]NDV25558.1 hypothetical protein [Desulfovibrio sp. JC010]
MSKKCTTSYNQKRITLVDKSDKEAKAELHVENKEKIKFDVIDFDGCVKPQNTACDYVLVTNKKQSKKNIALYVELKGSDIPKAYKQIEVAAVHYKHQHNNITKTGIVSFTGQFGTPKTKTKLQLLEAKFRKKYNLKMIRQRSPATHRLNV